MRAASVLLVVAIAGGRARADEPHHHHHHHHHDAAAPSSSGAPGAYAFTQGAATGTLRLVRDRDLMCALVVPDATQPAVEGHLSARIEGAGGRGTWAWADRGGLATLTIDGAHLRGSTHDGTGDDGAAAIPDTPFEATYSAKLRGGPRSVSGLHVLHVDGLACEMAMREHHDDTVTGSGPRCGTFTGHRAGDLVMGQWVMATADGAGARTLTTLWRYKPASSGWFVNGTWGQSADGQASCDGGGTVIGGFVP